MPDTPISYHTSENTPIICILDGNQPSPHHFTETESSCFSVQSIKLWCAFHFFWFNEKMPPMAQQRISLNHFHGRNAQECWVGQDSGIVVILSIMDWKSLAVRGRMCRHHITQGLTIALPFTFEQTERKPVIWRKKLGISGPTFYGCENNYRVCQCLHTIVYSFNTQV